MTEQGVISRVHNTPGMNVNALSAKGVTALMASIKNDSLYLMRTLLAHPEIDVNAMSRHGNTALHLAALTGKGIHVKALLDDGRVDLNVLNSRGETALCIAAKHNRPDAVESLLNHELQTGNMPTYPPGEHLKAYRLAADRNAFNAIVRLLHFVPEFLNTTRADGHTALTSAIKAGRLDVVQTLLQKYPDIDVNLAGEGMGTALNVAASLRNFDTVLTLLRHPGLDPNVSLDATGKTVLHEAASRGDANMVQALMSAAPAIDVNAQTQFIGLPLHCAVLSGDVDTIRVLTARTNDINHRSTDGWSVLHFAAFFGETKAIQFLLQQPNIDPTTLTNAGHYPSDIARQAGHAELARILDDCETESYMRRM